MKCDLIPELEGRHQMTYRMGPWAFQLTLSDVAYKALRKQALAEATKDAQKRSPEFAEAFAEAEEARREREAAEAEAAEQAEDETTD